MSKNKLLILDKDLEDIEIIIKSISSDVSYVIYEENDMYGTLLNKILKLNLEQINDIGLIRKEKKCDTYDFLNEKCILKSVEFVDPKIFSWNVFKKLLISFKVLFNLKVFNFISCNLNSNTDFQYIFNKLEETGVKVGTSSYKIGNEKLGGSWILDKYNYNIKDNYFTDEILNIIIY